MDDRGWPWMRFKTPDSDYYTLELARRSALRNLFEGKGDSYTRNVRGAVIAMQAARAHFDSLKCLWCREPSVQDATHAVRMHHDWAWSCARHAAALRAECKATRTEDYAVYTFAEWEEWVDAQQVLAAIARGDVAARAESPWLRINEDVITGSYDESISADMVLSMTRAIESVGITTTVVKNRTP